MLGSDEAFSGNREIRQPGRFQSFLRHIRIEDDLGLRGYSAAEVLRPAGHLASGKKKAGGFTTRASSRFRLPASLVWSILTAAPGLDSRPR
jgi:hypothetical protein